MSNGRDEPGDVHHPSVEGPPTVSPFHGRVTGWDSNVIQYGYDDANRMTSTTLPSGTGTLHGSVSIRTAVSWNCWMSTFAL